MKDFYDLYVLARDFEFDGSTLVGALKATFKRRKTEIPSIPPLALTDEFGLDAGKSVQWKAFIRKSGLEEGLPEFLEILSFLKDFLMSPARVASGKEGNVANWEKGGPWR